jgi:hypothetical protein
MLRRSVRFGASAIPRSVWDPKHHDQRWVDSYAKPIADRRNWPAKVFSVAQEPRTPREWLFYSKRNLAYAYNAAMRACGTFPETIEYYLEMKVRGIEVDLDTAFTLISRAARFEKMEPQDVFKLWDETTSLGARSDVAVLEVLHTVWDHSAGAPAAWREARRRELVDKYNDLAREDIRKYAVDKPFDQLMLQQLGRYAKNLGNLGAALRYDVWAAAFAHINNHRTLTQQVCAMLRYRAGKDVELLSVKIGINQLEFPNMAGVLRRHSDVEDDSELWRRSGVKPVPADDEFGPKYYEDVALNGAFLAAINRVVDAAYFEHSNTGMDDRGLALQLLVIFWQSRAFITSDVFAQIMDIVRFSEPGKRRDNAARQVYRRAYRGGNAPRGSDISAWIAEMTPLDARVVARYIMSVDPWSEEKYCFKGATFDRFTGNTATSATAAASASGDTDASSSETALAAVHQNATRNGQDVDERMAELKKLIRMHLEPRNTSEGQGGTDGSDGSKTTSKRDRLAAYKGPNGMQLLTARAVFLRDLALPEVRNVEVCGRVLEHLRELRSDLDELTNITGGDHSGSHDETPLSEGPETEMWESMLTTVRAIMDATVEGGAATAAGKATRDKQALTQKVFSSAADLRAQMVEESMNRFNGKFRMLWLQEA